MMTPERLRELIDQFPVRRIAVLGDFFLDKYLDVDPDLAEMSVETGKVAHQVVSIRCAAGAAGTVVNNLVALGCQNVETIGAIGCDGEGFELRRCLERLGCNMSGLIAANALRTPTYLKPRDRSVPGLLGEHSRYDTKNREPLPQDVIDQVIDRLRSAVSRVDAVIVCDQVAEADCGVVHSMVREAVSDSAEQQPNVVFWADSRRRIRQFRNVILKPNQFELVGRDNPMPDETMDPDAIEEAMLQLRQACAAPIFVTLGERGILCSDPNPTLVPGIRVDGPVDSTGAGDSATAGAVLALTSGATSAEAALMGNLVASLTIQQLDTTGTTTPKEVIQRLDVWREQHS